VQSAGKPAELMTIMDTFDIELPAELHGDPRIPLLISIIRLVLPRITPSKPALPPIETQPGAKSVVLGKDGSWPRVSVELEDNTEVRITFSVPKMKVVLIKDGKRGEAKMGGRYWAEQPDLAVAMALETCDRRLTVH
jgi:hypothetical protein